MGTPESRDAAYHAAAKECPRCGIPCRCLDRARGDALIKRVRQDAVDLASARLAAERCGIREGETLAEFIRRLHDETLADRDDT